MSRVISREIDPHDGQVREFRVDDLTNKLLIVKSVDIEDNLDANVSEQNNGTNGFTKDRNFRKIASIPQVVADRLRIEHGIDIMDPQYLQWVLKWLRDRDNRKFVTCSGRF